MFEDQKLAFIKKKKKRKRKEKETVVKFKPLFTFQVLKVLISPIVFNWGKISLQVCTIHFFFLRVIVHEKTILAKAKSMQDIILVL